MKRLALLLCAVACGSRAPEPAPPKPPPPDETPQPQPGLPVDKVGLSEIGLSAEKMDRKADPCEDFYRFACGGWSDRTQIPADQPKWSTGDELRKRNEALLKTIVERAAKDPGGDPILTKIGGYHNACMDEAAVEQAGTKALAPLVKTIGKVKNIPTLNAAISELHKHRVFVLYTTDYEYDYKDSSQVIATVQQDGLGLPDRDYYLAEGADAQATRAAYQQHVERMLRLSGMPAAASKTGAAAVLKLETDLAKIQKPRAELRDVKATYHRLDRAGLAKTAPTLGWDGYFRALGFPDIQAVNVPAPTYLEQLGVLVPTVKPPVWKAYLTYHLFVNLAPYLPGRFVEEGFQMTKLTTGQKEPQDRWRRCLQFEDADIGFLVAQPFVKEAFGPEVKASAENMVKAVTAAFGRSLTAVGWMDAATQEKAAGKLAKMGLQIGYPETWRKYDIAVDAKNFAQTHLAAARFEMARRLGKIGKPVDRNDWPRTPQQVNAFYDPSLNQMVILAGILQAPFYNPRASVAVNMGAMGMVVGHEITHGYDDQGAVFDANGNMSSWWPDEVNERFKERAQCVAKAYSAYEVIPGLNINGDLTLGENIADIGGVKMAFRAYRALRKDAKSTQLADGLNEDQQFFLALGQAWCSKESDAYLRKKVATDPHSPHRFRILGALSHNPDFARTFQCKEGAKMRPEKPCEVW